MSDPLAIRGIPRNLTSYVCVDVIGGDRPILFVTRADGDWCFLCGSDDPTDPSVYRVAGIGHVLDLDPTVAEVLDLGVDEEADRAVVGGPWTRTPC